VKAKLAGKTIKDPRDQNLARVVDLMEALRQSAGATPPKRAAPRKMAGLDGLWTCQAKQAFKTTPDLRGREGKVSGNSFIIQKHAATRLHVNFRLEMEDVPKSRTATKGQSLDPAEKWLAVMSTIISTTVAISRAPSPKGNMMLELSSSGIAAHGHQRLTQR